MKPFSKKAQEEGQGLCNYCGKWKPTDLTPEQLEAIDWKCADCAAQRGQAPDEQKSIEKGQKPITKYDPEYEFLVKLIKLLSAEGVPPQEMQALAKAYPFETVDDVGDLTAKIWTLATEKYHIPREWLTKKLGKYASIIKNADLWPSQEQAQDMLSHEHNSLSYNNDQEPDTSVSGPRPDEVAKEAKDLNIDDIIKILNAKEPQVTRVDTANHTLELIDGTTITFD